MDQDETGEFWLYDLKVETVLDGRTAGMPPRRR